MASYTRTGGRPYPVDAYDVEDLDEEHEVEGLDDDEDEDDLDEDEEAGFIFLF
jgi:hypothetical protein